ncbi:hypothetical protein BC834DRAFT_582190 [Gloeopeniophorella convolvens]|nr:hypothetical protein BC834DRAFT_582190 [Gloeopeniophorella convolvens]
MMGLSTSQPAKSSSITPFNLFQLPTEVIVKILALLDVKELLASQLTSRRLREIISDSLVLQYHIQLAASGLCDGPVNEISTAERTNALQAYNKAWLELGWSSHDIIELSGPGMPHFSDGIAVSLSSDRRALVVNQLPSRLRKLEAHCWTLTFDFVIAGFAVDASQDLVAIVPVSATPNASQWCESRILLRTLSAGESHPLTIPSGVLQLQDGRQPSLEEDTTNICGDHLGTVVYEGSLGMLAIWNWKTGQAEWSMPMDKGMSQWCFLDDAHIVFPKNVSSALGARQRRLHVHRFREDPSAAPHSRFARAPPAQRVFALPASRFPRGSSMGARLLSRPETRTAPHAQPRGVFCPDPADALLTLELWAYSDFDWEVSDLHIPPRLLLAPPAGHAGTDTDPVPWEAWGAPLARTGMGHPRDMAPLGPFAYGMRRIAWNCGLLSRDEPKTVSVYDLHPGRVAQALRCGDRRKRVQNAGGAQPYILSEVLLPEAIQDADPIGIKIAMCGDALVVFELGEHDANKLHVLTF